MKGLQKFSIFILFFILLPFKAFASLPIDRVETNEKMVALTFDADMTPSMLDRLKNRKVESWYNKDIIDILNETNTQATLFLTGLWIKAYPDITRQLSHNSLFELGNHSYSHGSFTDSCYNLEPIPNEKQNNEIRKTEHLLLKYADKHVKLFRFPGLCFNQNSLSILANQKYTAIGGDIIGHDGFQNDSQKIINNVENNIKPGSIIILHMSGGPNAPETATALKSIISDLKSKGFTFVKVSDLINTWN